MKFSIQLPTHRIEAGDEFASALAIQEMARAAEAADFDACYVTDHPFPTEEWLAAGHHAFDPFVALAFAAAATERIRLHTYILVLPYRNPFITAKSVASLDILSGGRMIVGAAAGYLEGEYEALGADYAHRNEVSDETIVAMKRAWTGECIRMEGRGFSAKGNRMLPRPVQEPHPPIWIGGNSQRAIRRVAELAEGWMPFPTPQGLGRRTRTGEIANEAQLAERIDFLKEHAAKVGREIAFDICMVPFELTMYTKALPESQQLVDSLGRLEALGVNWTSIAIPCRSRSEYLEQTARLGAEVVARFR